MFRFKCENNNCRNHCGTNGYKWGDWVAVIGCKCEEITLNIEGKCSCYEPKPKGIEKVENPEYGSESPEIITIIDRRKLKEITFKINELIDAVNKLMEEKG